MTETAKEFKDRIETIIRLVVIDPADVNFIDEAIWIFEPLSLTFDEITATNKIPASVIDFAEMQTKITKRLLDIIKKNPSYNEVHANYFQAIYRALIIDSINADVPNDYKEISTNYGLKMIADYEFIHDNDSLIPQEKQLLKNHLESVKTNNPILSFKEYFEKLENENQQAINKALLFDVEVIKKLDTLLRGQWFESNSPSLTSVLQKDNWVNNTNSINWTKEQQELPLLFYLLNENSREISTGTITQLISKTFKVKSEIKTEKQLSKSLSNAIVKYYSSKPRHKSPSILEIERIISESKNHTIK